MNRLQALADVLVDKFSEAKLMQRQREQVKLHLTVMNTLFRKDPGEGSAPLPQNTRGSVRDRESFNASLILRVKLFVLLKDLICEFFIL